MSADSLRSYQAWSESLKNFEWLAGAVPGATDIDMLVERSGNFLFIEVKPWQKGVVMPTGQHRALRALSEQPRTTVWVVGERDLRFFVADYATSLPPVYIWKDGRRQALWPADRFRQLTQDQLREEVTAWWNRAEGEEEQ